MDGYSDYSRTTVHSADVEMEAVHDMEGLALEDRGGSSHRSKTWWVRPEALSIVAGMEEVEIVEDMALPSRKAGRVAVNE